MAVPGLCHRDGDQEMKLYTDQGYLDLDYVLSKKCPFTLVIGGRGTGKTYGSICYALDHEKQIAFIRRTQTQIDLLSKPDLNPFQAVAYDRSIDVFTQPASKQHSLIFIKKPEEEAHSIGFMAALSTFSNMRGFSSEQTELLIYDEFIPETHERSINNEDTAFFNMYETINRNREIKGRDPLQALLLSNSNFLASPILLALGLADVLPAMRDKGQTEWINQKRGIALFNLWNSPISQQKRDTALYRATAGSSFGQMALDNDFALDDLRDVRPMSLNGCRLLARIGKCYLYSYSQGWYVSLHGNGKPRREYEITPEDVRRFKTENPQCWTRIMQRKIRYENFQCKNTLTGLYR